MTESWVTCSSIPVYEWNSLSSTGQRVDGSEYLIWILGSKVILSNSQSKISLWVLETCLNVGLLSFMIILITASLTSKMYYIVPLWQEFTFEETKSSLDNSRYPWETGVFIWEFNFLNVLLRDKFFLCLLVFLLLIWVWVHDINNQMSKIKRRNTIHS